MTRPVAAAALLAALLARGSPPRPRRQEDLRLGRHGGHRRRRHRRAARAPGLRVRELPRADDAGGERGDRRRARGRARRSSWWPTPTATSRTCCRTSCRRTSSSCAAARGRYGMMQGLDESFDGVVFVGYHASTTNPAGVRAHSFSSANLADVRLNGASVTEGGWNAALAAHYGVPVLAVSGDEAAVAEVQAQVPGVEGAVVKWPYAFHSARTLSPAAARTVIADAVRKGMARRGTTNLPRVASPIRLEIRFKSYRPAELLSWLPGAERVDAHAVALHRQGHAGGQPLPDVRPRLPGRPARPDRARQPRRASSVICARWWSSCSATKYSMSTSRIGCCSRGWTAETQRAAAAPRPRARSTKRPRSRRKASASSASGRSLWRASWVLRFWRSAGAQRGRARAVVVEARVVKRVEVDEVADVLLDRPGVAAPARQQLAARAAASCPRRAPAHPRSRSTQEREVRLAQVLEAEAALEPGAHALSPWRPRGRRGRTTRGASGRGRAPRPAIAGRSRLVISPIRPEPIARWSTRVTATICTPVPVRNTSSAR